MASNTHFVLLGLGRCGSNLLKFALKENPDIAISGELFNRHIFPEVVTQDGASIARKFYKEKEDLAAAGFKLFYHHGRREPTKSVWRYLTSNESVKIIHLKRLNSFRRLLSLKVADSRGQWIADDQGTADITILEPPETWEADLIRDETKTAKLDKWFRRHDVYQLSYEQLVDKWDFEIEKVQLFLEVNPIPLQMKIPKQETKTPRQRCPNYDELIKHFRNTRFEWMFDSEGVNNSV